jgi:hypothetical protein
MNKGFLYEKKILEIMKNNNLVSQEFLNQETAGCDNTKPDMVLCINGHDVNIEVKKSIKSQAGGTSIRFDGNNFEFVKPISGIDESKVFESLSKKKEDYLRFMEYHNVKNIPFTTTKDLWNKSVEEGLLKPTNCSIDCDISFIENHYNKKNTFYIQIGGKGLYYMTHDILGLGLPRLKGDMKLEIRPVRSGSKLNKEGIRISGATLRVQARILNIVNSDFNLESIETIKLLTRNIA